MTANAILADLRDGAVKHVTHTHVARSIPSGRPSVIIPSGQCSTAWLWDVLDVPWYGDLAILPGGGVGRSKDVHPVRINWAGQAYNGGLS